VVVAASKIPDFCPKIQGYGGGGWRQHSPLPSGMCPSPSAATVTLPYGRTIPRAWPVAPGLRAAIQRRVQCHVTASALKAQFFPDRQRLRNSVNYSFRFVVHLDLRTVLVAIVHHSRSGSVLTGGTSGAPYDGLVNRRFGGFILAFSYGQAATSTVAAVASRWRRAERFLLRHAGLRHNGFRLTYKTVGSARPMAREMCISSTSQGANFSSSVVLHVRLHGTAGGYNPEGTVAGLQLLSSPISI